MFIIYSKVLWRVWIYDNAHVGYTNLAPILEIMNVLSSTQLKKAKFNAHDGFVSVGLHPYWCMENVLEALAFSSANIHMYIQLLLFPAAYLSIFQFK